MSEVEVEVEGGEGGEKVWERSGGGYCDGCWCVCERRRSGGVVVWRQVEVVVCRSSGFGGGGGP